jgi:heterodisulfide reductase subunit A
MKSALALARQGFEVYLVEKNSEMGGHLKNIHYTLDGLDVQFYLSDLIRQVYRHPLIHVSHDATITDVSGYVGNFITTVESEGRIREISHGAAILATGADEYLPTEYSYGENDRVLTQLELEDHIIREDERLIDSRSLVMIQCVGCREEDKNYCARICCNVAIKNSLKLKELNPEMDIYILFRDMRTYGFAEDHYRKAAEKNVNFIRWETEDRPHVDSATKEGKPVLRVTVPDPILGQRLVLDADFLVLSAALVPSARGKEIARLFKAPLSPDGFFQEAHVKLRPVDFAAEGVYTCGTAHYPKHISETIAQAYGAAGRAVTLLSQDTVTASGAVCDVKEDDCVSCGACIAACTYGAIEFRETPKGKKACVNPILCTGDGLCNAKCPTNAILLKHYTDEEILSQIDAAAPPLAEDHAGKGIHK